MHYITANYKSSQYTLIILHRAIQLTHAHTHIHTHTPFLHIMKNINAQKQNKTKNTHTNTKTQWTKGAGAYFTPLGIVHLRLEHV